MTGGQRGRSLGFLQWLRIGWGFCTEYGLTVLGWCRFIILHQVVHILVCMYAFTAGGPDLFLAQIPLSPHGLAGSTMYYNIMARGNEECS